MVLHLILQPISTNRSILHFRHEKHTKDLLPTTNLVSPSLSFCMILLWRAVTIPQRLGFQQREANREINHPNKDCVIMFV